MVTYLVKSAVIMAVLLGVYYMFLGREKIYRFNRYYLLSALCISFILPLVSVPYYVEETVTNALPVTAQLQPQQSIQAVPQTPSETETAGNTLSALAYLPYIVWGIYGVVTLLLMIRFGRNIRQFYNTAKSNEKVKLNGATVVLLNDCPLPYTFMQYIFVSKGEYNGSFIEEELLTHELAHVRQRHTLDVLFTEVLKTIFWFNPLLYVYKKTIQTNHEFLADDAVVNQYNNIPTYQLLLLDKANPPLAYALASSINFNLTKKRFAMMTKTTSRFKAIALQAITVPVFASLFLSFSVKVTAQQVTTNQEPPVSYMKVNNLSDKQVDSIRAVNPKLIDKPGKNEHYTMTETTTKDKKGIDSVSVSYSKYFEEKNETDFSESFAGINPNDIENINVVQPTAAELDSLLAAEPKKYTAKDLPKLGRVDVRYRDNGKLVLKHFYSKKPDGPQILSVITTADYPQGMVTFQEKITREVAIPKVAKQTKAKIIYTFNVTPKGKITGFTYQTSTLQAQTEQDKAFITAINKQVEKKVLASGLWIPAKKDGKPVTSVVSFAFTVDAKS